MDVKHVATVSTGAQCKVPIAAWAHNETVFIATPGLLASEVVVWGTNSTRKEVVYKDNNIIVIVS